MHLNETRNKTTSLFHDLKKPFPRKIAWFICCSTLTGWHGKMCFLNGIPFAPYLLLFQVPIIHPWTQLMVGGVERNRLKQICWFSLWMVGSLRVKFDFLWKTNSQQRQTPKTTETIHLHIHLALQWFHFHTHGLSFRDLKQKRNDEAVQNISLI